MGDRMACSGFQPSWRAGVAGALRVRLLAGPAGVGRAAAADAPASSLPESLTPED
jgi:hypothetical protein